MLAVLSINSAEAVSGGKCSADLLTLTVCTTLIDVGKPSVGSSIASKPCCAALLGLADLDAAICLCLALKANLLGIFIDIPLALNLVLSTCNKNTPRGFQCN
ncbi:Lipid transfer protein EARLI 1 [Linum grandiflorum]